MFEKSLFDLIKGLRSHKGAEDDYIQNSLRECKVEIRSQDMDKKATALLKIIYLEMFGYDMSWASFHVLEVMSSGKYIQKRVGYLGAVQSFRSDTEVLMLATNLLKKDIASANLQNMSLPLVTLPHIMTPSLAMSLLPDVLARISHSHAVIRKKAVVTLYRLSLLYPDALKLAWPKLKERLLDDQEDSSVVTAVVNVVCELGWRRPHDFLPLAPRFFDLLVDGRNNWMAIKIIKLFATLTPIEPRLIRKLLRPLANLIRTTTAMSLLYECINGVIQGGILDGDEVNQEQDEIAALCVEKLRGMVVLDADPNLKYVALLAFNRIVTTHPMLVATQQDVIMECLDDADMSIRLQALDLVTAMVSSDTLRYVIDRLVEQLRHSAHSGPSLGPGPKGVRQADSSELADDESAEKRVSIREQGIGRSFQASAEYRLEVMHRVVDLCSRNNYADLMDFEWYIDVLVQLVAHIPAEPSKCFQAGKASSYQAATKRDAESVAMRIGSEIRNVAVRVRDVRQQATQAAEALLLASSRTSRLAPSTHASSNVLGPLAWVVGEYAEYLSSVDQTLLSLIDPCNHTLPARTLAFLLQAVPKVLIRSLAEAQLQAPTDAKNTHLLLSRVINFLEALADHPDLDVQERAAEFLEILRLSADSMTTSGHECQEIPLLLTSVLPGLFAGLELNPVALTAQKKVPLPDGLALSEPFNDSLVGLFSNGTTRIITSGDHSAWEEFYFSRIGHGAVGHANDSLGMEGILSAPDFTTPSDPWDGDSSMKKRLDQRERIRDDPFYIAAEESSSGRSTPFRQVLHASRGELLDIDAIPIVDLKIENDKNETLDAARRFAVPKETHLPPRRFDVAADETIDGSDSPGQVLPPSNAVVNQQLRHSLLQVDSSGLARSVLENETLPRSEPSSHLTPGSGDAEEMAKAMAHVQRLRLEMQRATERIELRGIPPDGTLVTKKKKKKKKSTSELAGSGSGRPNGERHMASQVGEGESQAADPDVRKKKKKNKTTSRPGER